MWWSKLFIASKLPIAPVSALPSTGSREKSDMWMQGSKIFLEQCLYLPEVPVATSAKDNSAEGTFSCTIFYSIP